MPRPRRKPAPPGRVQVISAGRSDPEHGHKHLHALQMINDRFTWVPCGQMGRVPVTGHRRGADCLQTIEARCGRCRRHLKSAEERFAGIVQALAQQQDTAGERPVIVDISLIEYAL